MPVNLLDDFPAPICHAAADGALTYCNRAWLEFTGLPLKAQLGDGWAECIHPEDRGGCLGAYHQAVVACQSFECEYRLRRWDGEYRWMLDIGRPFYDSMRRCSGYVRVCYDNTDRKLSSEGLHTLLRRLNSNSRNGLHVARFGQREEIGPALTALLIHLALMQSEFPNDADDLRQHLKSAIDLVQVAVEALWEPERQAGCERPDVTGLNLAMMSYCDEATNQYNIPINYSGVEISRLKNELSIAMMRLLQEALASAHDYAMATRINVALQHTDQTLRLIIEDNGNGMNCLSAEPNHTGAKPFGGLLDIQERFQRLGGGIKTEHQSGRGGCLIGVLPLLPEWRP